MNKKTIYIAGGLAVAIGAYMIYKRRQDSAAPAAPPVPPLTPSQGVQAELRKQRIVLSDMGSLSGSIFR